LVELGRQTTDQRDTVYMHEKKVCKTDNSNSNANKISSKKDITLFIQFLA